MKKLKTILIWTLILNPLMTFAQNFSPRPVIEGYRHNWSAPGYVVISKDPNIVAQFRCAANDHYVHTPPGGGWSGPDWPYDFSQYKSFKCAGISPSGEPVLPTPCCGMEWKSGYGHSLRTNYLPEQCTVGNPISIATGEKVQIEKDLHLNHSTLSLERIYNSGPVSIPSSGSFGNSWSHTYNRYIISGNLNSSNPIPYILYWIVRNDEWVPVYGNMNPSLLPPEPPNYAYVTRPNGKSLYFYRPADGIWRTDYATKATLQLLPNDEGWLFISEENIREHYDMQGRLLSVENAQGQIQTLSYDLANGAGGDDNSETLDRVVDDKGNFLSFVYNANNIIEQVNSSSGEQIRYSYETTDGILPLSYLTEVAFDDEQTRRYHYSGDIEGTQRANRRLVGITDENNIRFATWEYDSEGRAILSEHAGGAERTTLSYQDFNWDLRSNGRTRQVTVTNSLNKETTYHYRSWNGVAQLTQVEGHPTANCAGANKNYTYYDNGLLETKTDWQGNTTRYTYNTRNLEATRTEAEGTPEARIITTEWHPTFNLPTKITEPERETVMTYDDKGRVLSRQVYPR